MKPKHYHRMKRHRSGRRGNRCAYCGEAVKISEATRDHFVPKSKGGSGGNHNIRLAHQKCNLIKGSKIFSTVEDAQDYVMKVWAERLANSEQVPRHIAISLSRRKSQ